MKLLAITIIATLSVVSGDVSHLLAASLASSRYIPPIPNALRGSSSISSFGDISGAAQTQNAAILPPPQGPVPDSATQGPNPQDIATPEPEYIDIDLPFDEPQEPIPPPRVPVPAPHIPAPAPRLPAPVQRFPAPISPPRGPAPIPQRPIFSSVPNFSQGPAQNYLAPINQPAPGHTLEADGYHYRIPRRHYYH